MIEVQKILPELNKIITAEAEFTYDKLVIATGCKTNYFGNAKMEHLTYPMKNTQEAIAIRNNVLQTFETVSYTHLDVYKRQAYSPLTL